jgi:2-dehydropantoate 2-reductase
VARVAVIGSGAVGSYYGALLARAGHDVRFLMRRDLAAVRERGLDIRSHRGDFRLAHVVAFADPAEIGPCEWVICSLKATALNSAPSLVAPCVGPGTRLVALMNGLGVEEQFAGWFPGHDVFGAMAFVCINRGAPGVVHHLDYGRVSIGHHGDDAAKLESLRELLAFGGIEVVVAPNLRYARWEKLCWNVPFNGLSVAAGGVGTKTIMGDPALRRTAEAAMREVVAAGNADLAAAGSAARLPEEQVVAAMFAQTETMGDYRTSMVIDYVTGQPIEVEAILGEPSRRAASLSVAVPTIDALYALASAADRRRRGLLRALTLEDVAAPK